MRFNQKKTSIIVLLFVASLLVVLPIQMVKAQTSTTTVTVTPQTSTPVVGQTITISITLNNVQNLYGIDVKLNWNTALLSFQTNSNQTFLGVSNGVLNPQISVVLDSASQATGEFHLVATSVSPATGFSGSGTIATLKFTVTGAGKSSLTLNSTLADYAPGGISEPIAHNDLSGTVDATASSSASSTPSSSSSSPTPTPKIPEFPLIATLFIVVVLASIAIVLAVKKIIKPASTSNFIQFQDNL